MVEPLIGRDRRRVDLGVGRHRGNEDIRAAELEVNAEGKAPLLCVTGVHKIVSAKLTFAGRIMLKK